MPLALKFPLDYLIAWKLHSLLHFYNVHFPICEGVQSLERTWVSFET